MVQDVVAILTYVLENVFGWLTSLFESTGTLPIYLAVISMVFAVKFILLPIVGGGSIGLGADTVLKAIPGGSSDVAAQKRMREQWQNDKTSR